MLLLELVRRLRPLGPVAASRRSEQLLLPANAQESRVSFNLIKFEAAMARSFSTWYKKYQLEKQNVGIFLCRGILARWARLAGK